MENLAECYRCKRQCRGWLYLKEIENRDVQENRNLKDYFGKKLCLLCRLELKRLEKENKSIYTCDNCVYFTRMKLLLVCSIDGSFTTFGHEACENFKLKDE